MSRTSKDLLELEQRNPSFIEPRLLVHSNYNSSQTDNQHPGKNAEKLSTTNLPPSQVFGRVQNFLGIMANANKKLEDELDAKGNPREEYDIEVLTGNEKEYIEMDLVLGVADLHTPEAVAAAESTVAGTRHLNLPSASSSSSQSATDSEDDEDDSGACSEDEGMKPNLDGCNPSRTEQPRKRTKVTELP
ncbi:hypothetical protein H6P81_015365 [Aristolochia fimbriata]|uniref:Uncharacterized protein n=1 Tax=Aristolochia fimbriata TaxID=158543 RepID=A0AAV7E7E7_ARIFI|nr:hypothetical protein H6P81_015365 [Aristolochia fimbriata]